MENALGKMLAASGPKPGQRWPNMGKPAFGKAVPAKDTKGQISPSAIPQTAQATKPQQSPDVGKMPPAFSAKPPPFDTGAAKQRSGAKGAGPVQMDGTQNALDKHPAPAKVKAPPPRTTDAVGVKQAKPAKSLAAMADKMHPVRGKR